MATGLSYVPGSSGGALVGIYNTYGDTPLANQIATDYILQIYKFYYSNIVEYRLVPGYYVDQFGIVKNLLLVSDYNSAGQNWNTINNNGGIYANAIKTENPRYIYPLYYEYRIAPYDTTDRFLFNPLGVQNHRYNGSKLSGLDVNIDSTETVDGGPVVKITRVNQNQIVFSNNNITTAQSNTSGLPARQLTSRVTSGGTGTISSQLSRNSG